MRSDFEKKKKVLLKVDFLKQMGDNILIYTDCFDIVGIENELAKFTEFITKINKELDGKYGQEKINFNYR